MKHVGCHPHPEAEGLLKKLEEYLLLLLLKASPMRLLREQEWWLLLALLEDELRRPEQALVERSKIGPGDSESARGWRGYVRARRWFEQRQPLCVSFFQLRLYRQS